MEDHLLLKTPFDGRQVGGHIGRQPAGRLQASLQAGLQAGRQAGWPGRCITLPLAVRRYGFYVDCVEYITLLTGMGRRTDR